MLSKKADPPLIAAVRSGNPPDFTPALPANPRSVEVALAKQLRSVEPASAKKSRTAVKMTTQSVTSQPAGFYLTTFMASFMPGLASPEANVPLVGSSARRARFSAF